MKKLLLTGLALLSSGTFYVAAQIPTATELEPYIHLLAQDTSISNNITAAIQIVDSCSAHTCSDKINDNQTSLVRCIPNTEASGSCPGVQWHWSNIANMDWVSEATIGSTCVDKYRDGGFVGFAIAKYWQGYGYTNVYYHQCSGSSNSNQYSYNSYVSSVNN